jgi:Fic family protein
MVIVSTKERYGTEVWQALVASSSDLGGVYRQFATVGEVSDLAGVSRITAKKYLEILVEQGAAERMKFGSRFGYLAKKWA